VRWLSPLIATAVGLWCTRGLLDIVNGSSGVTRVAMLPPWWLLVACVFILSAVGVVAIRAGANPDVALPLCALGLLAVPYLPWLPDRVPALRAAAGPGRYLLWLVVFWLITCRSIGARRTGLGVFLSPLAIFLASAVAFGAVAWRLTDTPLFPGGDEPHYLVITQSLLHDGDLKIEDNHRREEYRAYFNGSLKPDYLAPGKDGQIYSIHPVGLPVLAAPAFALGGYHAVVAMLVVMAALAAALLWQWAREITGSVGAATFAWAAAALTAPFLFNSFTVYPEIPAALAVMVAIGWRTEAASAGVMLCRGAAIGALPWLSTKYAPMAAAVAMVVLLRTGWNRRAVVALVAPIAIAFAAWFAFFFLIWGSVSPSAPYGLSEPMTLKYLARGAPGLIFDQEYGVVWTAPVLVMAFVGLAQMLRSGGTAARRALELTFIFGALLCTVGAFHVWWGGEASAGRPVASGVLLFGIPIASLFASTEGRPSARAGCHLLLASSLAIAVTLAVVQGGALVHNDRDASAVLLDWASPTWPLSSAFPSFLSGSLFGALGRTLAWLALGTLVAWLVHVLGPRAFGGAALATLGLGFTGAVALVSLANTTTLLPAELAAEGRARVPLLDRFDVERRPTAVLYNPLSRIASSDALSLVSLVARRGLRTAPQPIDLLWNARFALPAGTYRVRLRRNGASAKADTTLALQIGRTGPPLEQWDVAGPLWERRFVLPVDAVLVGFRAQQALEHGDGELQLTPDHVVDEGRRISRPPIIGARRYGAVTVFFHDDFVFAEPTGYWTRGRASAQVTYAMGADASSTIHVVVRCGPVLNRVTLSTPGWEEQLAIAQGESRHVAIPTTVQPDLGVRIAPLEVSVQQGFVPADVDRAATDRRFLGCRIEPGS
jgi:hypothetical protein